MFDAFAKVVSQADARGEYIGASQLDALDAMEIILRYVTYAAFSGDASVLDDRCVNGLRETYVALGTPGASVAAGVQNMKAAAIAIVSDSSNVTSGECSNLIAEIGGYFDRAAAAVA